MADSDSTAALGAPPSFFADETLYAVYRWSSNNPDIVAKAKLKITDMKHKGGKASVDFNSLVLLADGFVITRKEPCVYATGFAWFYRALKAFQAVSGNSDEWRVLPLAGPWATEELAPASDVGSTSAAASGQVVVQDSSGKMSWHPFPGFKLLRGSCDHRV